MFFVIVVIFFCTTFSNKWTETEAQTWYSRYSWSAGINYIPAYATNQIQMWQQLNLADINQELSWAGNLGFTKLRVFLHIEPYINNSTEFISNIFSFLAAGRSKGHKVIFVLFDDCWKSVWKSGKQPQPISGLHNSQWVQCPGDVLVEEVILKSYVTDIIGTFKNSQTVVMWDLYNEVGNYQKYQNSLPLLKKVFQWARVINPSQPLTSAWWNGDDAYNTINQFILTNSDVITFHSYCDATCTGSTIEILKKYKRPVICTEYMARELKSKFITHLPLFKTNDVWAMSWGFVFGRTQAYYAWWSGQGQPIPDIWFCDVLKPDGTPFDKNQTQFIKDITNEERSFHLAIN